MDFSDALRLLKAGHRVARHGWNGKGMFLFLTDGREIPNTRDRSFKHFTGDVVRLRSHIDMCDAQGAYVSGWLASSTDMMASDWYVVE